MFPLDASHEEAFFFACGKPPQAITLTLVNSLTLIKTDTLLSLVGTFLSVK